MVQSGLVFLDLHLGNDQTPLRLLGLHLNVQVLQKSVLQLLVPQIGEDVLLQLVLVALLGLVDRVSNQLLCELLHQLGEVLQPLLRDLLQQLRIVFEDILQNLLRKGSGFGLDLFVGLSVVFDEFEIALSLSVRLLYVYLLSVLVEVFPGVGHFLKEVPAQILKFALVFGDENIHGVSPLRGLFLGRGFV